MSLNIVVKDGSLVVRNEFEKPVTIWKIEFSYYVSVPRKELEKKPSTIKRRVSESIRGPLKIMPGQEYSRRIGLTSKMIEEIVVYYDVGGRLSKEKISLT